MGPGIELAAMASTVCLLTTRISIAILMGQRPLDALPNLSSHLKIGGERILTEILHNPQQASGQAPLFRILLVKGFLISVTVQRRPLQRRSICTLILQQAEVQKGGSLFM